MTLETQIEQLEAIGIAMNDGVTVDDLLHSFDRNEYEKKPFDALLFMFGSEIERPPWGRYISSVAWNFDAECIVENGDYTRIVDRIAELTGQSDQLRDVSDSIDLDAGTASLAYTINGTLRQLQPVVDNDWADHATINTVLSDFETDDWHFYGIDNGQSTILYFLTDETAAKLNSLAGDVAVRMVPKNGG
ncbi:hypothetical protein LF1_53940 [Rubripirellula obstinata]|uniref:Uncharacterized protein n=1 Tax=Rubripirellula obstinata TaxID=406547 RepID=A0A5B1CB95_9BACT|nr:hypothetical protein [Rubripirellula obstinata]KAA1257245.1 hypothetical protein LF1_53940 [Rubripirellula obstinata]